MLKKGCGRKSDSGVWKYFSYDRASDKTRCLIELDNKSDSNGSSEAVEKRKCDALLCGNNATNLKNHLKYKHKVIFTELEKLEAQTIKSKKTLPQTAGDLPKQQSQLNVQVGVCFF